MGPYSIADAFSTLRSNLIKYSFKKREDPRRQDKTLPWLARVYLKQQSGRQALRDMFEKQKRCLWKEENSHWRNTIILCRVRLIHYVSSKPSIKYFLLLVPWALPLDSILSVQVSFLMYYTYRSRPFVNAGMCTLF